MRECCFGVIKPPPGAAFKESEASGEKRSGCKPYLQGKDIRLFTSVWKGRLLDYEKTKEAAAKKGSYTRAREPGLFEVPCKLLVRRTGTAAQACLDFDKRYVEDKIIVCHPSPRTCDSVFLHFLLGYLNSEVGWFWFRLTNPQDPSYMPSLRQADLESLWVPVQVDAVAMTQVAVLSHRIAQTLASGYFPPHHERIVAMRRQLLARIAKLLDLCGKDVNLILQFLDESHSVAERPFKSPRRIPPVPVVELPTRPLTEQAKGELWDGAPLLDEERRKKADWEDIINGPLPDIYEHVPEEEDLRLGRELKAFADRLEKIERLLKGEAEA